MGGGESFFVFFLFFLGLSFWSVGRNLEVCVGAAGLGLRINRSLSKWFLGCAIPPSIHLLSFSLCSCPPFSSFRVCPIFPVPSDTSSFTAAQLTYTQLFLDKTQLLPPTAQFPSISSAGATKSYHDNIKRRAHGLEGQFFRPRFRPQTYLKRNSSDYSQSNISTLRSTAAVPKTALKCQVVPCGAGGITSQAILAPQKTFRLLGKPATCSCSFKLRLRISSLAVSFPTTMTPRTSRIL
jgi:hypothetical protein